MTRATMFFALALGIAQLGCGSSGSSDSSTDEDASTDEEAPAGPATGSTCPSGSTLTYDNFGKPFFDRYCVTCHSSKLSGAARMDAPDDHNFDSLAGIRDGAEHIDEVAAAGPDATNTAMPPSGHLLPSPAERKQLGEWLACGAP